MMIKRTVDCFGIEPERLVGDTGYGSAETLGSLVEERGIEPHIPVFDKSERTDDTFLRDDFRYDHDGDVYFCPSGKVLTTKGTLVNDGATLLYRASTYDCGQCELKPRCCPNTPARKIPRSIHEGARDLAREIAKTDAYATSGASERRSRCCSRTSNVS
jgi:hypothetical protein